MLTLSVETLLEAVRGELLVGDPSIMVNGLTTDSRRVEPGMAFVAISGERADGHDHVAEAISLGARAAIITRDLEGMQSAAETAQQRDAALVKVDDALAAIQDLAVFHRGRLFCPVIGVTGSTGKTTTKDFLHSVLSLHSRVVSTEGNQNNELGVPFTILSAGADTDVLVVEMAMRGLGQIERLCEIARPIAGLVTNVGTSHIEMLGSQEAITSAKGELVRAIPDDGRVFLNADDPLSEVLTEQTLAEVVRYGLGEGADVRAVDIEVDEDSCASFKLISPSGQRAVSLSVPGRHNVYNALAAAAVSIYLEVPLDDVAAGLSAAHAGDMRMQVFQSASGVQVINDAYNANPSSMRAAIEALAEIRSDGSRIAVLGDMAELGSLTELAHFRIGEEIARLPIDYLVTVGEKARRIGHGARAEGMSTDRIFACLSPQEAIKTLEDILKPSDVVLIKASRVMGLERVVERIVEPIV